MGFEVITLSDVVPATPEEQRMSEIQYRKAVHAGLNLAHDWLRAGHSMASLARLVHLSLTSRCDPTMHGRFIEYLKKKGGTWTYKRRPKTKKVR